MNCSIEDQPEVRQPIGEKSFYSILYYIHLYGSFWIHNHSIVDILNRCLLSTQMQLGTVIVKIYSCLRCDYAIPYFYF